MPLYVPTAGAGPFDASGAATAAQAAAIAASLQRASNLSDLASAATARTSLGLGTAATMTPATLAADTAFTGAFTGTPNGVGQLVSGFYSYCSSPYSATTGTTGTGTLRLTAWVVPNAVTITRIGAEVTTIGDVGSKFRIGIYSTGADGKPGTLVLDAGQIAGDSATVQELTVSQALTPGLYWVGGVTQSVTTTQPTLRVVSQPSHVPLHILGTPTSNQSIYGWTHTSTVAGALPAPMTATPTGANPARIFVKVA